MNKEEALDFLKRISDGIAEMFGENCEVVVHDMKNFESSIIYIANKHVTQREIGEPLKILGTKDVEKFFKGSDLVNCKGTSKHSHLLKSSTFHAKGEDYHYALGINFDYTNISIAHSILGDMMKVGDNLSEAIERQNSVDYILEDLYSQAVARIGKPVPLMHKQERVRLVAYLDEKGAFSIHKSIPIISSKMDVSRFTIYNYLKEIRGTE
ncbi:MAG TPA: helix-turn-helix transcriptional regulator [Bacillota bacterium]|nr:helix-turn-helix transcriptional regulator [Bacillota bacterium]